MQEYIPHLFYLSLILLLGILITAITNKLKLSNILFLVIAGYLLSIFDLNLFNDQIILILSSIALVVILVETTMDIDIVHIVKNFVNVLKFSVVFFILCIYTLTLLVFQLFEFPGKGFEIFVLSLLLSIIIYGVDPTIVMEFFKDKKSKVKEMLRIEGIISGPLVVIFAFFIIDYLNSTNAVLSESVINQLIIIIPQLLIAFLIGIVLAYGMHLTTRHFPLPQELFSLSVIVIGVIAFALGETIKSNGTLAVAFFGLFLRTFAKKKSSEKYNSALAHIFYLIVFILLGTKFVIPMPTLWLKGAGLFAVYLLLRFASIYLFFKSQNLREKLFMTLNTAKGLEVAFVLLIINLNFSYINGLEIIVSLGFMFFILSYIISTIVNHFSDYFLVTKRKF